MYRSSFAAITLFLNNKFPTITNIYLNNLPTGFVRPSFFVQLVKGTSEDLNRIKYRNGITWQLVYYSPQDQEGNIDVMDQLAITEQLQQNLMEIMILAANDGVQYQILGVDVEQRDKELYCTVILETVLNRPEVQYELMQSIETDYREG